MKLAELSAGKGPQATVAALAHTARGALAIPLPPWLALELAAAQRAAQQHAAEIDTARRNVRELEGRIEAARAAHKARRDRGRTPRTHG